jgi:DNA-directed RNA polymerase specialized sigma24 family protein
MLLAKALRAKDTHVRAEAASVKAFAAYRRALAAANRGGVTKATLARELGTSESRVRQHITRAKIDTEVA